MKIKFHLEGSEEPMDMEVFVPSDMASMVRSSVFAISIESEKHEYKAELERRAGTWKATTSLKGKRNDDESITEEQKALYGYTDALLMHLTYGRSLL